MLKGAAHLFQHIPQMNTDVLATFTNSLINFLGKMFYCIFLCIIISVTCSTKSKTNLHLHKDKTFYSTVRTFNLIVGQC